MIYLLITLILAINAVQEETIVKDEQKVRIDIELCQLEVDELTRDANFSCNIVYTFKIDEKGQPTEIHDFKDTFLGKEKVIECISRWRIIGIPDKELAMVYYWKHGYGWSILTLSGKNFSYIVKLPEPISQYVPQK